MTTAQLDRFIAKIYQDAGGCWVWTGYKMPNGYAVVQVSKAPRRAELVHRLFYTHFIGTIPEGLVIDHLCRNRCCCNPTHLEPVTCKENSRRGLFGVLLTPAISERLSAKRRGQPRPFPAESRALYKATIQTKRATRTQCKHGHFLGERTKRFHRNGYMYCGVCANTVWRRKREAAA